MSEDSLSWHVAALMTADFNREAGPLVDRNRDLASSYLMLFPDMSHPEVFKINTDKNTLGNGVGMLTSEQLAGFKEAFPMFVDPDAYSPSYPDLVTQVIAYWKKNEMVPSAVAVLDANAK